MCEPTTIMMVGMAVMAAAAKDQQNKAINRQMQAKAKAARLAASYDYQTLTDARGEADEQAAQQKFQRQLQTQREMGTVSVAIGEAGVGGQSAMRVMDNALMQGSYDMSVIEANRLSKARQNTREVGAVHAKEQGRVMEAKAGMISGTQQALSVGMAGASGAASGYSMGNSMFKGKTMKETSLQKYKRTGVH